MATPKTIIGGDDVRAIIADCGSWAVRVGSAGEDTPRSIVPSAIGTRPSRKRLLETDQSGPDPPLSSPTDVVMKDVSSSNPSPPVQPPATDGNSEFVGATPADPSAPRFRPPNRNAGDILLTSPLAFTDVQPVYDFDRTTGAATVRDWDAMQAVWEASANTLRLNTSTSPLLIVEPTRAWSDADRAHALERAFEGCGTHAAFIGRGAAMAAFSAARTTACVVDVGHQGACAVPIVDGFPLRKSTQTSAVGGLFLSERLRDWTERQLAGRPGYDGAAYDPRVSGEKRLRAHHELKRTNMVSDGPVRRFVVTDLSRNSDQSRLSESHKAFYRLRVMDEMKAYTFRVSQGKPPSVASADDGAAGNAMEKDPAKGGNGGNKGKGGKKDDAGADAGAKGDSGGDKENGNGNGTQKKTDKNAPTERMTEYELPDGNKLSLANDDGLSIAEQLFTTSADGTVLALPELAFRAVSGCDVDSRRDLFGSVVVVGGTSLISGTVERFTRELAVRTPQMYKLKVQAASNVVERSCGAWIGGSIVASLGTFQQTWISKAEYDELGSRGALRKCA